MASSLTFINPALSTRNVGDLFIVDSLKKILDFDPRTSIDLDPRQPITAADIDKVNQTRAAIIAGTNLWYRRLPKPSRWNFTLEQLERIRVPIIPFGVGTTRHFGEDNGFEAETLDQIRCIHERCALAGARDERTLEVLNEAGIRNVSMTGCPTLFRAMEPAWTLRARGPSRQVVVTVRAGQRHNARILARRLRERGLEPVVAAQKPGDRFLRWPVPFVQRAVRTLFAFQVEPYLQLVRESLGAIGWRLHGNMLHLAHGNPALVFSNCSRGESFSRTFDLPTVRSPDGERLPGEAIEEMVDRLLDPATFQTFSERFARVRAQMVEFLRANDLPHHLSPAAGPSGHSLERDADRVP